MLSRKVKSSLEAIETPFYLYDMGLLRQTLESVTSLADHYGYKLHYAVKANFDPRILKMIGSFGIGADCCSANEIRCALEAGFDASRIVYTGVGKKDSEIRYAISKDIYSINCESLQELEVLDSLAAEAGKRVRVGLRVNPDIDPRTNKCIDTGQADSKFGISYEEILDNTELILGLSNLEICGMHLHVGSQIRELHVFEYLCNKVNVIVDTFVKAGFKLDFIDVGGGLGINYDVPENEPVPNFASEFSIIDSYLKSDGREVHFEFGRSIVGQCGELITRVLYNKTTATGRKIVIVDGSMTELIRPALYGSYHNIENISSESDKMERYTIVGTACESTDVFNESITLPLTKRGDLITLKSAGAYGMSMASRYNLHDLPAAVYSDEL